MIKRILTGLTRPKCQNFSTENDFHKWQLELAKRRLGQIANRENLTEARRIANKTILDLGSKDFDK